MAIKKNSIGPLEITVERFDEYQAKKGVKTNLLGFATVTINNVTISGIKVMKGKSGIWTSFPSTAGTDKDGNTVYYPNIWFNYGSKDENRIAYDAFSEAVRAFVEEED